VARRQENSLRQLRRERSAEEVRRRLDALKHAAAGTDNLMPYLYDAAKVYATVGEICDALRTVFGTHEEIAVT
jgi:methylmalonyl-CoA mutase, N-terminal domain